MKVKGSDGEGDFVEFQFYLGLSGFGRGLGGASSGVRGITPDSADKGLKG